MPLHTLRKKKNERLSSNSIIFYFKLKDRKTVCCAENFSLVTIWPQAVMVNFIYVQRDVAFINEEWNLKTSEFSSGIV